MLRTFLIILLGGLSVASFVFVTQKPLLTTIIEQAACLPPLYMLVTGHWLSGDELVDKA